jgi:hypothetical protein
MYRLWLAANIVETGKLPLMAHSRSRLAWKALPELA